MRQDSSEMAEIEEPLHEAPEAFTSSNVEPPLEDYRQRYGLSLDPFGADPYFPFFTGGQRRELLDQIIHICQFGRGLPVVLGERGVGKTRIALALYEAMGSESACYISALPTLDAENLLRQIAHYFGLDTHDDVNLEQLLELLQELGLSYGEDGLALVLIDNAQDLDDKTLAAVLLLVQGQEQIGGGLQLVLIGDLSLIGRLNTLNSAQIAVNDLYVERFTLNETLDYLNFRMEMADYLGPEMFTESLIEPWWRQSHGQIVQVHRSASRHLLEAVLPPLPKGARPFPLLHIVAIAVLGGAVLMTLLYRGDKENTESEPTKVATVPIALPQPIPNSVAQIVDEVNEQSSLTEQVQVEVIQESEQQIAADEKTLPQTVREYSLPARQEIVSTQAQQAAEAKVAASAPEARVAAAPVVVLPQVEPTPVATNTLLSEDEQTLLSWRAAEVTLQLLGVSTEKAARDYIVSQVNRDSLLMFKTQRQGKDWFVVVEGRYPNIAAARAAIARLPAQQAKAGPWPRELKVIQAEIER